MPTLGVDCQIILDGHGYFVEPRTYAMKRIRVRKSVITKGGQERYTDSGPGKRTWHMILLCLNQLVDYTGQPLPSTGLALRNQLVASYGSLATVAFTDLDGISYTVHFDDYEEQVRDPRTQLTSPSYHVAVVLVEA
jgi:hypothetical protein